MSLRLGMFCVCFMFAVWWLANGFSMLLSGSSCLEFQDQLHPDDAMQHRDRVAQDRVNRSD